MGPDAPQPHTPSPGLDPRALLEEVLGPLLDDFAASFERGLLLLDHCPETVRSLQEQHRLRLRLCDAQAELAAARALRAAAPAPMALDMATITPWHTLLVEVWSLSATLRAIGITP